jgi:hypothetical protein
MGWRGDQGLQPVGVHEGVLAAYSWLLVAVRDRGQYGDVEHFCVRRAHADVVVASIYVNPTQVTAPSVEEVERVASEGVERELCAPEHKGREARGKGRGTGQESERRGQLERGTDAREGKDGGWALKAGTYHVV